MKETSCEASFMFGEGRWIEKGQYNPSLLLAYRIAKVFCTSVEELYCLEENLELDEKQYREL